MRTYEEVLKEIAEWDEELSDALDELCSLHIAEETVSMLHALDDEEIEWLEIEYAEIQERIDSAEFWLGELESELDSIKEAASDDEDGYDELIAMVEVAEENALCELAAFGFVAFENDERYVEGEECETFWLFAEDVSPFYIPFDLY